MVPTRAPVLAERCSRKAFAIFFAATTTATPFERLIIPNLHNRYSKCVNIITHYLYDLCVCSLHILMHTIFHSQNSLFFHVVIKFTHCIFSSIITQNHRYHGILLILKTNEFHNIKKIITIIITKQHHHNFPTHSNLVTS